MIRRFINWLKSFFGKAPLSEPDRARLAFLGAGYELSNGELDRLTDKELTGRLLAMRDASPRWALIVNPTKDRREQWWVHRLMLTFGPPVSALWLDGGRRCFLTWAATT